MFLPLVFKIERTVLFPNVSDLAILLLLQVLRLRVPDSLLS
jgi:hypothetical protein